MTTEIKKLLSIRNLRENKAQKYYELQIELQSIAEDKKHAQVQMIQSLEQAKKASQIAFENYLLSHLASMDTIKQSQLEQAVAQTNIEAAQKQLNKLELELDALKKEVEKAYLAYMASIKAKQKIETVLKEENQKARLEASKEEDKKLEEIAEVLAVR
jgi:hypothetical protein